MTVKEWDLLGMTCVRTLLGHRGVINDFKVYMHVPSQIYAMNTDKIIVVFGQWGCYNRGCKCAWCLHKIWNVVGHKFDFQPNSLDVSSLAVISVFELIFLYGGIVLF